MGRKSPHERIISSFWPLFGPGGQEFGAFCSQGAGNASCIGTVWREYTIYIEIYLSIIYLLCNIALLAIVQAEWKVGGQTGRGVVDVRATESR